MMENIYCPDCDGKLVINPRVQLGQKLVCPHCDAELEVISIDPVELDWAYDWSWDEEEYDEDDDEDEDW